MISSLGTEWISTGIQSIPTAPEGEATCLGRTGPRRTYGWQRRPLLVAGATADKAHGGGKPTADDGTVDRRCNRRIEEDRKVSELTSNIKDKVWASEKIRWRRNLGRQQRRLLWTPTAFHGYNHAQHERVAPASRGRRGRAAGHGRGSDCSSGRRRFEGHDGGRTV